MSKYITIQEGGQGKQITADKLKTNVVGGGTCFWVPEDEVQLTTKYVHENGEYSAEDDGYYGYSKFVVSVAGGNGSAGADGLPTGDVPSGGIGSSVIGTDPDSGDTNVVGVDENGNLVTTVLPSSISVITPPSKTSYNDGGVLDPSGIEVQAYLSSGEIWSDNSHPNGIIPISELTFNPIQADIDMASNSYEIKNPESIGVNGPFYFSKVSVGDLWDNSVDPNAYVKSMTGTPLISIANAAGGWVVWRLISSGPFTVTTERKNGTYPATYGGSATQYSGRTIYLGSSSRGSSAFGKPYAISAYQTDFDEATKKAFTSMDEGASFEATQDISVSWNQLHFLFMLHLSQEWILVKVGMEVMVFKQNTLS